MVDCLAFSPTYVEARERLLGGARQLGLSTTSMDYPAEGPGGESLFVDAIRIGEPEATRVVLHLSGLHGVEGFLGSAIQLDLLQHPPTLPADTAILIVHGLNAYGMSWLRRVNENNVDLNRNYLTAGTKYEGVHPLYRRLDNLLNPQRPPTDWDSFYPQALTAIARFGFQALKQAIAEGQYEFPRGLFFGGRQLEPASAILLSLLEQALADAHRVTTIDVHSGLGRFGAEALLVGASKESPSFAEYRDRLGENVAPLASDGVAYRIPGALLTALPLHFSQFRWTAVGQEFGTFPAVKMLKWLRAENQAHHFGDTTDLTQPSKQRLLRAFCPPSSRWRTSVLKQGRALVERVLASES